MLHVLLAKDLRRAWRNPLPWLLNLALPLCIAALIGLAFGDRSDAGALGRIRFAVVDEDDSVLTRLLRGAAGQGEAPVQLDPVFLDRPTALRELEANRLSAVFIIPKNFTHAYFTGEERATLELVKNPAQSIHPTVIEELLGVAVAALNAIGRNLQPEFAGWQAVFEGEGDYRQVAALIERAGDRLAAVGARLNPPLVTYVREQPAEPPVDGTGKVGKASREFNLFGYLLAGLSAMFLLFIASTAMRDLHYEAQNRTFARYHTVREALAPWVAGKALLAMVLLLLSSGVMLGGGALLFGIRWQHPGAIGVLTLGYAAFATGLMAVLTALAENDRIGDTLNTLLAMVLGIAGGCAFPPQQLPGFIRDHVSPWLPTYWYAETVRGLEFTASDKPWVAVAIQLTGSSLALLATAAWLFRRRLRKGWKP